MIRWWRQGRSGVGVKMTTLPGQSAIFILSSELNKSMQYQCERQHMVTIIYNKNGYRGKEMIRIFNSDIGLKKNFIRNGRV